MIIQENITHSFQSPILRIVLIAIGTGLLYVLWREVRKIPAKLLVLMATAFLDMVGLLMIIPLLPFYVKSLGGGGVTILGFHFGIGIIVGFIIAAFTLAQLFSAPIWGRLSERVRLRPVPLIPSSQSVTDYIILRFANSLLLLSHSLVVQGAGIGTVGVIQSSVADTPSPQDRARALS